jgi:hypothetical protein
MPKRGENRERFRKDCHRANTNSITDVAPGISQATHHHGQRRQG